MTLQNAIALIKHNSVGGTARARWADLGCGAGLFTYALANLLQPGSSIIAIDKKSGSLQQLSNPNNIIIQKQETDFIQMPVLHKKLDGILMANSFHYVADKISFINRLGKQLTMNGIFLIVEYDTDKSNPWVPYPASARSLEKIFANAGFHSFTKLQETPSMYNAANIYAALIKK